MTEEAKQTLLKYLTGNLDIGHTEPIETYNKNYTNNLDEMFDNTFMYLIDAIHVEQFDEYIVYGNQVVNNQYKGFMIICDNEFKPIQFIDSYESGTKFSAFAKLKFDENNNIYGIDFEVSTTATRAEYRFIMISNPLANKDRTYKTKIKYSLNIDSEGLYEKGLDSYKRIDIQKVNNQPIYIMAMPYGQVELMRLKLFTLKLEVGQSPEWYSEISTNEFEDYIYPIIYHEVNNGALSLATIYCGFANQIMRFNYIPGSTMTFATKTINDYIGNLALKSKTELYGFGSNGVFKIDNCNTDNWTYINLYSILYSQQFSRIMVIDELVLFCAREIGENKIIVGTVERYDNVNVETISISASSFFFAFASKTYNLCKIVVQHTLQDVLINARIYNYDAINDSKIELASSLFPNQVLITNNNFPIFARNLYNITFLNNRTTSIVQIPNMLLNDIPLQVQELWSLTNYKLVTREEEITKNIYETLYLNFNNTIYMLNETTGEYNMRGATRLNMSSTDRGPIYLGYDQCKLTRFKVNYMDNTSFIGNIPINEYNNNKVRLQFTIFVKKQIRNIELLTEDDYFDETIYNTITTLDSGGNVSDLIVGRYYEIEQWVEVR